MTPVFRPDVPTPAWEWHQAAYNLVRERHDKIDRDRESYGQPLLIDADMTSQQRANGIKFVLSGPQNAESIASAAVQCVAFLAALLRAEDQAHFGDAA